MEPTNKYLVLSISDIEKYLTTKEQIELIELVNIIEREREFYGKCPFECVVIKDSLPVEYQKAKEMVLNKINTK